MKRVLDYKLPIWGIPILAIVALASALMAGISLILSIRTPAIPSAYVRPVGFTPAQIAIISYLVAMGISDLILAAGLLLRWNKARIITIILSPAPVIGLILNIIYQAWADQLIATGQVGVLITLWPLTTVPILLILTGVSFPAIAPLIGIHSNTSIPAVLLALLNIGTIIYLSNKHIKAQFKKQKPTQTNNTPPTLQTLTKRHQSKVVDDDETQCEMTSSSTQILHTLKQSLTAT